MIPGFNHNLRTRDGRVFHVQTEDSGTKNPHVITHVFVGGNIIASKKTEYAELLSLEDRDVRIKKLMEDQHKEMLRNAKSGAYDAVETGTAYELDGPVPVNLSAASTPPVAASPARSVFGEDLISDQTLDDVILKYLTSDGTPPKPQK